jgi:predicted nucleic acid-binding protein
MRVFLDTSALAKRYVAEPGSEELEQVVSSLVSEVFISTLALVEFGSALGRKWKKRKIGRIQASQAMGEFEKDWQAVFIKIPVSEALAESAASLALTLGLKGADAVHLASAQAAGIDLFVASDRPLSEAAQKIGLKTYDPESGPFQE